MSGSKSSGTYKYIMEYYPAIKKNKILLFATTWMEQEGNMRSVMSDIKRQIPYDFTYMRNLKNYINEQTKQKHTHIYKLMVARWQGSLWGWVKKVKGFRSTNWYLQNSHGDVKYSLGNMVNNIVITMYGATWLLEISVGHFLSYINV